MYFKGKCREIDRIVVSDPRLLEGIPFRYERDDIGGVDWRVLGLVGDIEETRDGQVVSGKRFVVVLHKGDVEVDLQQSGRVLFPAAGDMFCKECGVFTTSGFVGIGIDDRMDDILESDDEELQDCCLYSAASGMMGKVLECSAAENGEVKVLVVSGCLGDFAGYSQEDIKDYLVDSLQVELEMSFSLDEKLIKAMAKSKEEERRIIERDEWEFQL